jgi:hypothetical protein
MGKPNFLIVGVQKAATTSMRYYLSQHPNIFMATALECHYFNRDEYYGDEDWYAQWFIGSEPFKAVGECTPDYDRYLDRVKLFNPDMTIIVGLRDPVKRAISAYWMMVNTWGFKLPPIEEVLKEGWEGESDQFRLLSRGHYEETMDRILARFERRRVFVYHSEDLAVRPTRVLSQITDFLDVPKFTRVDLKKQRVGDYPSAPDYVVRYLRDYYRPHMQALFDRHGIQVYGDKL